MKPNVVGFIFARGGSKGLPRKNVRPLAGKPLIAHAIDVAKDSRWIRRVVISTDDYEIADVARQYGAEVPFMRPPELASDTAPELLAWRHALEYVEAESDQPVDVFVSVPATAPLRIVEDVDRCIEALLSSDADLSITVSESRRNPYFSMVSVDDQRIARLMISSDEPVTHRQTAPRAYDIVPCAFAARPEYIRHTPAVYAGKVIATEIAEERAIDIDCEMDFRIAEMFYAMRQDAVTPMRKAG